MKVAICTPFYGETVKARFADCLAGLLIYAGKEPFNGELLELERFIQPGLIPTNRNAAAMKAIKWGAEWVLSLEYDQTFPKDTLHRLLAHDKPLVGANYRNRHRDEGVAVKMIDGEYRSFKSSADMPPLEPVYLLGLGVTLIKTEVLAAVANFNKGPPFLLERNGAGIEQEDYPFIHKAGRLGYECYVDNRLSMEVGHLSEVELKFT